MRNQSLLTHPFSLPMMTTQIRLRNKRGRQKRSGSLTKLEWFGLVSGVIGLVADVYSLSQIFTASKNTSSATTQGLLAINTQIWILVLLSIIYTVFIFAFFSRRIFSLRHISADGVLSDENYGRIEAGAKSLTRILGMTLLSAYTIAGFLALIDAESVRKAAAGNDIWMKSPAEGLMMVFFGAAPVGLLFSYLVVDLLNVTARALYSAFDPKYRISKKWYDD